MIISWHREWNVWLIWLHQPIASENTHCWCTYLYIRNNISCDVFSSLRKTVPRTISLCNLLLFEDKASFLVLSLRSSQQWFDNRGLFVFSDSEIWLQLMAFLSQTVQRCPVHPHVALILFSKLGPKQHVFLQRSWFFCPTFQVKLIFKWKIMTLKA